MIRSDITVRWDLSPRLIIIDASSFEITMQDLIDTLRTIEATPEAIDEPYIINASGKEALGGGVTVGLTVELQNARIYFEERSWIITEGICTGTDTTGTNLYDSSASFLSDNIEEGFVLHNHTTNSVASVLSVLSDNSIYSLPLSGPNNNEWTIGDMYHVFPNELCRTTGGNLVAVDTSLNSIYPILQSPNVQSTLTSSSSGTLQELAAIQYASFGGGVSVDLLSSYTGTDYPVGTKMEPVNNFTDALLINNERGFDHFHIIGDASVDTGGDYSGIVFIGESQTKSILEIDTSANVLKCEFYDATIIGTLDGESRIKDCIVGSLNYINGIVEDSALDVGNIILSGGTAAHFWNCRSAVAGSGTPIIDLGGSGQDLDIRNYYGGIKLTNKTGSDKVSIDLGSGQVVLDNTVTNGEIVIRGVGKLIDTSGNFIHTGTWNGCTIINETINISHISEHVWDVDITTYTDVSTAGNVLWNNVKKTVNKIIPFLYPK